MCVCVCVCVWGNADNVLSLQDVYAVVMEFLSKDKFHLLDSADDITCWTVGNIKVSHRTGCQMMVKSHDHSLNSESYIACNESNFIFTKLHTPTLYMWHTA